MIEDIKTLLIESANANTEPARMAVRDRLLARDEDILPLLLAAFNDDEPTVRRGAVRLLVEMVRSQVGLAETVATGQFTSLLMLDSDAWVRIEAARALRVAPPGEAHRKAIGALLTALGDDYPGVRIEAALALGHRLERSATDPLALLIETDPDPAVRGAAAAALAHMDYAAVEHLGPTAIAALITELDDPAVPPTYAIRALGILGAKRAVTPLIALLQADTRPRTRREICQALGQIGDASAQKALEVVRDSDPDERVRAAAVAALGALAS